ncbi:MAG: hypothetical protein RIS94_2195, partial [Pseudomonadota bacterium]
MTRLGMKCWAVTVLGLVAGGCAVAG